MEAGAGPVETAGTVPEAVPATGVVGVDEAVPDGPVAAAVPTEAVPVPAVGDVAVVLPPVDAGAAIWAVALGLPGVCPPLDAVPPVAAVAAAPVEGDDPPTAAVPALDGAGAVPEGITAALGPTFTATSSSLVVPRRRSCRWKRSMKSPWRAVLRTKTSPES